MRHMVAHEIGRLLLATQSHFRRGIMRAKWGPKDWQQTSRELVRFPPRLAELIRAGGLAHLRLEERPQN